MTPTQSLYIYDSPANMTLTHAIQAEVHLAINAIGSASFKIFSKIPPLVQQKVIYNRGFDELTDRMAFKGIIKKVEKLEKNTYLITAREHAIVLEEITDYWTLRFCSFSDICKKIAELSKLSILTPSEPEKKNPTDGLLPQFNNLPPANFRNALQLAMKAFAIPNACLLTLRDGSLYAGNLDQYLEDKKTFQMPKQWIIENKNDYTSTIPYPFRPANLLKIDQQDQKVQEVILRDNLTKLKFI